jgi:hypothetical protein
MVIRLCAKLKSSSFSQQGSVLLGRLSFHGNMQAAVFNVKNRKAGLSPGLCNM